MANVAIYYRTAKEQDAIEVIEEIEKVIKVIKESITGVYVDSYNHNDEFSNLINQDLSEIEVLYINRKLEDEFDKKLINELARTFQFNIIYFYEM